MTVDLNVGLEEHRRGRLDQAARIYEAALAENPNSPDALHLVGLVALQRGDAGKAIGLMERATSLKPTDASILANLAEAYKALGQTDRAVESCRAALNLQPNYPEAHFNLGLMLNRLADVDGAIMHFREAIRLRPEFAAAHNSLGNALRAKGDKNAAFQHFERAVWLDPGLAEGRCNLGRMLAEQGLHKEGLAHCREAVRLRPSLAAAHNNLGNVLQALGRLEDAKESLLEAVRLDPDQPATYAGLAHVWEQLGEFDQAHDSLRQALRREPRHAGALARLATRLRAKLPEDDQATIESLLAEPNLADESRMQLLFGLAQAHDAKGEFNRAAELSKQANALHLAELENRGMAYDAERHHAFVDQLTATFTPRYFERVRGFGLDTDRPIFVVGLPRSGTSLTEQILASHSRVFGAGELKLAQETLDALPGLLGRTEPALDAVVYLDRETSKRLAERHLAELAEINSSADRIVDKMPENTLYLGFIATLFPNAKVIHCRRDVRDVALSCWMLNFAEVRWACDADQIASRVSEYQRLMNHWRTALPIPIFELDYETLVADLEGTARKLVAFCGLDWEPACLEYYRKVRPLRTPSVVQVRQPVYTSSVGRWKNYEHLLAPLFANLTHVRLQPDSPVGQALA
jgi:tetratricopeptide (TPR) repeat protein